MDPTVTTAALRGMGGVFRAVLGRYRPVGVVRVGSAEDRAQAYRRLLDAATRLDHLVMTINAEWEPTIKPMLRIDQTQSVVSAEFPTSFHNWVEAKAELLCAVEGVRLCAPVPVISVSEDLAEKVPEPFKRYDEALPAHTEFALTRNRFLDAARRDLAYAPRWWQLRRKYKERRFQKQAARSAALD